MFPSLGKSQKKRPFQAMILESGKPVRLTAYGRRTRKPFLRPRFLASFKESSIPFLACIENRPDGTRPG